MKDEANYTMTSKLYYRTRVMAFGPRFVPIIEHYPGIRSRFRPGLAVDRGKSDLDAGGVFGLVRFSEQTRLLRLFSGTPQRAPRCVCRFRILAYPFHSRFGQPFAGFLSQLIGAVAAGADRGPSGNLHLRIRLRRIALTI